MYGVHPASHSSTISTDDPALRDYEPRLLHYVDELIEKLSARSGQTVNASAWFNFYSFDVMGDLAFGKSFDMLKGEQHWILSLLTKTMFPLGILLHAPWLYILHNQIPGISSEFRKFVDWCDKQVEIRRTVHESRYLRSAGPIQGFLHENKTDAIYFL